MPARARRRRRRLNPGPIFFLLLLGSIGYGFWYSPITSVIKVHVLGAPDWDKARVEAILAKLQDKPWKDVEAARIESEVLEVSAVRTAEFHRNFLGHAELKLTYRVPVAVLQRPNNVGLDKEGVLFTLHEPASGLPTLIPPKNDWRDELTIEGSWPKAAIADLCQRAQEVVKDRPITVDAADPEGVCLDNVSGAKIILGKVQLIPEKLAKLSQVMLQQPELLTSSEYLDIETPDKPASKPRARDN